MASSYSVDWRTAYTCVALRIAATLSVSLSNTPLLRLLESNLCRNYYRVHNPSLIAVDGSVPEAQCKEPGVQSIISDLNGSASVLALVPALMAAVLFLVLSKSTNKRRALLVNTLGTLMMSLYYMAVLYFYHFFDPRWMWLSGLFNFIGGGDLGFYSLIQASIAESVEQSSLSTIYLYTSATALVIKVLGSAGSLSMMKTSIWLPVILSVVAKALSIPTVFFVQGRVSDHAHETMDGYQPLANNDGGTPIDQQIPSVVSSKSLSSSFWQSVKEQQDTLRCYILPVSVCVLQEAGNSFRYILPYWLSKRFDWSLRETGWVMMAEVLSTALIVAILPRCFRRFQRSGSSKDRDLSLAKMCLGLSFLGTLLLGFSWYRFSGVVSLLVLAGGTAFQELYLSYVTAGLQREEIMQVYILLATMLLVAFSLSAWLIAGLYAICLHLNSPWATSIPLWLASLAFAADRILIR